MLRHREQFLGLFLVSGTKTVEVFAGWSWGKDCINEVLFDPEREENRGESPVGPFCLGWEANLPQSLRLLGKVQ